MGEFKSIFKRYEKKYLITAKQYQQLLSELGDKLGTDKYSYSTINNIYFDTPDYKLIRQSIEKPTYKEKLRLRCYSTPQNDTPSFVELKKKYKGVVYKRRIDLPYADAYNYLTLGVKPENSNLQIFSEIDWVKQFYKGLRPAMFISYDRVALFMKDNPQIRLTFDTNIHYRNYDLDLRKGVYGDLLIDDSRYITEIKIPDSIPLELCHIFDKLQIFPASYSKYGNAYLSQLKQSKPENIFCASKIPTGVNVK